MGNYREKTTINGARMRRPTGLMIRLMIAIFRFLDLRPKIPQISHTRKSGIPMVI